jgi:hypothetical protein
MANGYFVATMCDVVALFAFAVTFHSADSHCLLIHVMLHSV